MAEPMSTEYQKAVAPGGGIVKYLKALGPGFVYALTVLGTGDLISNSAAGASYGYTLIWALGLTLIFRYVWVNTSAKYVLVTGENLLHGYARLGTWVIWIMLISIIFLRHFYNLYQLALMGESADYLFHLPTESSVAIWAFIFTFLGFAIMFWGGYSAIELCCKVLVGVLGCSMVIAALYADPDPAGILRGTFIPSLPQSTGLYSSLFILMALIGTEAGSMTNLTYAYFIHQKGWRDLSYQKQQRLDLIFGVVCLFVMGSMLQIAAAGTVGAMGIDLENAEDLVEIFSESQGRMGRIIFALGLWGASFSTFVGATLGYALIITDICRNFIPRFKQPPDEQVEIKKDPIYRWSIIFWSFSPLYIVFTEIRPVVLVLTVSSLVVIMIPVLAGALVWITNDKKVMGEHTNSWLTNAIMGLLVAIAMYGTYQNVIDLGSQLAEFL